MAAAQARAALAARGWSQVEVGSAGVAAQTGDPASEGARRAAARHGLDLDGHAATPLTADLLLEYDLVLTMGPSHLAVVNALGTAERAAPITAFARSGGADADADDGGVRDPFGGTDAVYEATWLELESLVERVLDRLGPLVAP
jgi:protein arginine phosphatase